MPTLPSLDAESKEFALRGRGAGPVCAIKGVTDSCLMRKPPPDPFETALEDSDEVVTDSCRDCLMLKKSDLVETSFEEDSDEEMSPFNYSEGRACVTLSSPTPVHEVRRAPRAPARPLCRPLHSRGEPRSVAAGRAKDIAKDNLHSRAMPNAVPGPAIVGVVGGMGPAAGCEFQKRVINATEHGGTDQGHLTVIHISASDRITDRTGFLTGEVETNPGTAVGQIAFQVGEAARSMGASRAVVVVPCNTFHAPAIWKRYVEEVQALGGKESVEVLHILEATRTYIQEVRPEAKRVGLMSTTGTRKARVYHELLEAAGFEVLQVDDADQDELHNTIYQPDWGLKAVSPASAQAVSAFRGFARTLKDKGAEVIILGCTEIPLALPEPHFEGILLVDPMTAAARAAVRVVGGTAKLRRLS